MHKIGALIALGSGLFQILAGALVLGHVGDLGTQTINGAGRDTYAIIVIIFGAITVLLGIFAWGSPRGFSSFVLLAVFTVNVVVLVINGWSNGTAMTSLIFNIIGAGTILIGMFTSKKNLPNKRGQINSTV